MVAGKELHFLILQSSKSLFTILSNTSYHPVAMPGKHEHGAELDWRKSLFYGNFPQAFIYDLDLTGFKQGVACCAVRHVRAFIWFILIKGS